MTIEKLKVTKEVARALDSYKKVGLTVEDFARFRGNWTGDIKAVRSLTVDDLARALYVGYEVEKTPEELRDIAHGKIRDYYNKIERDEKWADLVDDYDRSWQRFYMRQSIREVLRILDVKIDGINA